MNFFCTRENLPEGAGFVLFGKEHLAALAVCLIFIIAACRFCYRLSPKGRRRFLQVIAVLLILSDQLRNLFLIMNGVSLLGYLPLHLCTLSMFLFPFAVFLPDGCCECFRGIVRELGVVLFAPGAVCALLFCNWTVLPIVSYLSFHSFFWHALVIIFGMSLYCTKMVRPNVRHWYYTAVFFLIIVPPILWFDLKYDCNYLFIGWPQEGSPIYAVYRAVGGLWRVLFLCFLGISAFPMYIILGEISFIQKKKKSAV